MRSGLLLLVLVGAVFCFDIPWEKTDVMPSPYHTIKITVAIKQQNLGEFEKVVLDVSNPRSANYGKYLSHEKIASILSPDSEYANIVINWFLKKNIPSQNLDLVRTKDVLVVRLSVAQVEEFFHVKLYNFKHIRNGRNIIRSGTGLKYSIPQEIAPYIDLIHGISELPPSMRKSVIKDNNNKINDDNNNNSASPDLDLAYGYGITGNVTINSIQPKHGTQLNITFTATCSLGGSLPCTYPEFAPTYVDLFVNSANPNIPFQFSVQIQVYSSQGQYWYPVEVPTYLPVNVSVNSLFYIYGFGGPTYVPSVTTYWPYVTVTTPQVVPQTLYSLYNIPSSPFVTNAKATQCVVEFEQQYYSPSDLDMFFQDMGLTSSAEITVIGPNDESHPGVEANLDIQWIMAMAPGAPTTFWSIYANSTIEIDDILQWEYAIGNMTDPPLVNSLSYGMTEDNVDKYLGEGYLNRSLVEFQKLAALGLTIIIADGDVGANDIGPPPMSQVLCWPSHADWPSNSAYVTAVGSTYITPLAEPVCYQQEGVSCMNNPLGEVTVSVDMGLTWTTGGGFSNKSASPSYQAKAVSDYFGQPHVQFPPTGYFNPNGRGYADAVTVGHNLMVVFNGKLIPVDGTSASAPIFAGIITLLNNARLNAGKSPLGFINPLLYELYSSSPSAFRDITVGHNNCGSYGWEPVCCPYGYQTSPGWDPVSGVGSPNYGILEQIVLSLP